MKKYSVSIIIPAYNEEKRIKSTLESMRKYIDDSGNRWQSVEILVVADGCTDGTEKLAEKVKHDFLPELKLVAYPDNMGKGFAVRSGVEASAGDIVLFADADGATPIYELDRLSVPIIDGGAEMVIASRRTDDANIVKKQPPHRKFLGNCFSLAVRTILGIPFLDTQCGFKVFKGDAARDIFKESECSGFAIDIELIYIAMKKGYRITEMGISWTDGEDSKVSPLKDGIKMLLFTIKLALTKRK